MKKETVIILDFGSQYSQLIARRIREINIYSKILPFNTPIDKIKEEKPEGIILSGGPSSVLTEESPKCSTEIFKLKIPVLGICYGEQLMVYGLNGKITPCNAREYGRTELFIQSKEDLFHDIPAEQITAWMSHGDKVEKLPGGFSAIACTDNTEFAAIANPRKKLYGIQFHPEVVHTEFGMKILENFCRNICSIKDQWTMSSYIDIAVKEIREKVKNKTVILALSGGVDSSVTAALINKAIGEQLICIFVNNGLLRKNEAEAVKKLYAKHFKINLKYVDAEKEFLKSLRGITDPEKKRKVIGNKFIEVFDNAALEIKEAEFLAQGTTYPDVIESVPIGDNPSSMIKSHHNVGGLPDIMNLRLLEPIRCLFKDEVRKLGLELGLPKEVVFRQPFPGPGLAVRLLGNLTKKKLDILREADYIVVDEIKKANLYYKVWQAFAVLLPVKSVGVMGDERSYENVAALRIVESDDAMTADWARIPHDILEKISSRIISEVRGINRVVLDITSKPPGTIEWE
ncbi:MAG: glutamine-hydrolyzing GMP synthase [Victivallales bacterium]|nr:glutamine-hydrolyzing GMP synthase [Victivallales bacterium]